METQIGARIKIARTARALSQRAFADLIQTDPSLVGKWERGESSPGPASRIKIVKALDVSLSWLASGAGEMDLEPAPSGWRVVRSEIQGGEAVTWNESPNGEAITLPLHGPYVPVEYEDCASDEPLPIDWRLMILVHDEVIAYIEMVEEISGQTSALRSRQPKATMLVYRFLLGSGGVTPTLRQMHDLMRGA